ncbi:MAG: sulfotransferase [Methanobacteriota archaeon]|nr:MAG: sulfotransferase [Euryarchaeota archaeon]
MRSIHRYTVTEAPIVIEKTVSNTLRPLFINRVFPDAKYIHLIRDGRDVVESAARQWVAPPDWNYIVKKSLSFPITEAFGYALRYGATTIRKLILSGDQRAGTWGPRYQGIDEDVKTRDLLEVCALQWKRSVQKSLEGLDIIEPERVLTIRYEEFVVEPKHVLLQVAEFLEIDSKPYSQNDLAHITQSNIGKGMKRIASRDEGKVIEIIRPLLIELGYMDG